MSDSRAAYEEDRLEYKDLCLKFDVKEQCCGSGFDYGHFFELKNIETEIKRNKMRETRRIKMSVTDARSNEWLADLLDRVSCEFGRLSGLDCPEYVNPDSDLWDEIVKLYNEITND